MSQDTSKSGSPIPARRKGIYILPNLLTTGSLFAGFFAIIAAMHNQFENAAIAIFVAMILDGLDGRVARLINAQSAFGAEYDSLSDIVSFGISPALVAYNWSLASLGIYGWGKFGWLSAFMYVACVALRLARFNSQADSPAAKRYFYGLPCPAAAAFLVSMVWVGNLLEITGPVAAVVTVVVTVLVSLLQVSNVRYRSFKDIDLKVNVSFAALILIVVLYILISFRPAQVLFILFLLYVLSGPIFTLFTAKNLKAFGRRSKSSSGVSNKAGKVNDDPKDTKDDFDKHE